MTAPTARRRLPVAFRALQDRILAALSAWPGLTLAALEQLMREKRLGGHLQRMHVDGLVVVERPAWPGTNRARDLYRAKGSISEV